MTRTKRGIGGHTRPNQGATDTWLTPEYVIRALGPFDLDPCAAPSPRPWDTAARHITWPEDGLHAEWHGRVWLNPPYGRSVGRWLARLGQHYSGLALIFARTETDDWHRYIWPKATGILFLEGRLHFHYTDGSRAAHNSGGPTAVIAYSHDDANRLAELPLPGAFVRLR